MDPISLQKQLRDNNSDLMSFCADLKQWGEEMKHKDQSLKAANSSENNNAPLVRNKTKKKPEFKKDSSEKKGTPNESKRVKGFDYSAWDKFDVDAECAKVDEQKSASEDDESSDLTDECDVTMREQAMYHKEKGNRFVKKEKWNQAIECYTKAIDCYGYDPIFYANRALCHLKNLDYHQAELDCTSSIQLDKTYVKAYHRRAQVREALNQLKEAHDDLMKVFDYEPDNKESKISLARIEKKLESFAKATCTKTRNEEHRPKSKFTMFRQQQKKPQNITTSTTSDNTSTTYWPSGNNVELINTISKAPHLRSRIPLRRIIITDADSVLKRVVAQPLPSVTTDNSVIKCDDFKVVERKIERTCKIEEIPCNDNIECSDSFNFAIPDTSVQFSYDWKLLKHNSKWRYLYLKQVHPKKFKNIFNESLDCDIFSGIINTLSEMFIEKNIAVYEYLVGLSEVKRFSMLAMFMTDADKKDLWNLVDYMKEDKSVCRTDIDSIISKYGL